MLAIAPISSAIVKHTASGHAGDRTH